MDDRFEQEFYRSPWQRVLPVGPDGIQPFVRLGWPRAKVTGRRDRRAAVLRALARTLSEIRDGLGAFGAFGRWGTTGGRPTPAHDARRARQPSVRTTRVMRGAPAKPVAPSPLRKAA